MNHVPRMANVAMSDPWASTRRKLWGTLLAGTAASTRQGGQLAPRLVVVHGLLTVAAAAQSGTATRDLPNDYYLPSVSILVSINLSPPGGVTVVGVEDSPPAGWSVAGVSSSGSYDAQTRKVKWGPFFAPSIPATLTYEATPPGGASGPACFVGRASFDGGNQPILGDVCIPTAIHTLGAWTMFPFIALLALIGSRILSRRPKPA